MQFVIWGYALLSSLEGIGSIDTHVAFTLLDQCASYFKLAHLARVTPPLSCHALQKFDFDIRLCFLSVQVLTHQIMATNQAQLHLRRGAWVIGHCSFTHCISMQL